MKKAPPKTKRKRGRPSLNGVRRCIYLTLEDYATFTALGLSNLSAGVRTAAAIVRETTPYK